MKRISGLNLARTSMLDIIILYLLSGGIRRLAIQKGLPPGRWVLYMVLAWFCMELIGISIALQLFGLHPLKIILMALPFGIGGYHIIRTILQNKPDWHEDEVSANPEP